MLKILNIISDSNIGGAGRCLFNFLKYYDRKKFAVKVVVPKGSLLKPEIEKLKTKVYLNDWFFNAKPHWDTKRIIIAVAAFFTLVIFQIAFVRLFGGNTISKNQEELDAIRKVASPMFNVLLVIVAPICEEFIFRALFFNTFFPVDNEFNKWVGIVVSGFVFAYGHDPMFSKFIYLYWVMGMILAWTYVTTKDVRYSILTHMLNNLLSIL